MSGAFGRGRSTIGFLHQRMGWELCGIGSTSLYASVADGDAVQLDAADGGGILL
jgi:hypothetical protein